MRLVPPEIRQTSANSLGRWWSAVLVRGQDRYGRFPSSEVRWGG
jgi:hypothetical protein